ncbi:hypothetical protein UR09_02920 [Candidatus Nitromaritima sp. SCGC AAA799-A02]|nr:hypothetical protein UZ36_06900 [Candidatus Nitromaritima sp. SCGC AAA799-C22]KMP11634.1 hypothetical protein UR09_02920 [Candidatus Nitromaritima sp. SCGC AAA799-A02]
MAEQEVNWIVLSHPALFRQTFPDRYVNNMYLDSGNMCSFLEGAVDSVERGKYRVRWYEESFNAAQKPVLELKARKNYFVTKIRFSLHAFDFEELSPARTTSTLLQGAAIPATVKNLLAGYRPVLLNRYLRSYFQAPHQDIMITVDRNVLVAGSVVGKNPRWRRSLKNTIIELKYPPNLEDEARKIMNPLPFRLTKNSKYMSGIEALCRRG